MLHGRAKGEKLKEKNREANKLVTAKAGQRKKTLKLWHLREENLASWREKNSYKGERYDLDWTINTIINDIRNLAHSFSCCNFVWVKRSCNEAAYATAKFALLSSPFLYFNKGNLPEVIKFVCKKDYPVCSVSWVLISLHIIKKKKNSPSLH